MAFVLDDLLNDSRLERLFSKDSRDCALQLWLLQIKSSDSIENRILYGRLLPYNYSNNTWFATDDDHFKPFGPYQAQVIRLNLYIKSSDTTALIQRLTNGHDLSDISNELNLRLKSTLATRVGKTKIGLPLTYRPVAYLLNREAPSKNHLLSPHGDAGALSASVSQSNKIEIFRIGVADFEDALITLIVEQLNSDTGLDFGDRDLCRLGDLELLVFPTLDDSERELLDVGWKVGSNILSVMLNTVQLPYFDRFHVRLSAINDSQIIYAAVATSECAAGREIKCQFNLPAHLCPIIDTVEVEIYGARADEPSSNLCCRWQMAYIRGITINTTVDEIRGGTVRLDWLERVTKSSVDPQRLREAQSIYHKGTQMSSSVGHINPDPWVPVNLEVRSLFAKLHPPKSDGRFFELLSDTGGVSRLEFVEWIKDLLVRHQNHQVLFFDPYFEDAGIGLIAPNAASQGDYVVFTTLPKPPTPTPPTLPLPKQEFGIGSLLRQLKNWWKPNVTPQAKPDVTPPANNRINNLLASCEKLKPLLKHIRLRVYGVRDGALHDRYILIADKDGLPISGFHLSNSIQKANENYPLLITPIPGDVLLRVVRYASDVLRKAAEADDESSISVSKMQMIFDSSLTFKSAPRVRFERLKLFNNNIAGDVLADLTGEQSLNELKGSSLRKRMTELSMLHEESLVLEDISLMSSLMRYLDQQTYDFRDFSAKWEVLGEILAHSPAGDILDVTDLSSKTAFLDSLALFLSDSFLRVQSEEVDAAIAVVANSHFLESIDVLLTKSYRPHHFYHPVKYAALTWPEYFAINILWSNAPDKLLSIAEAQVMSLNESQTTVKLSLLSQIVSEIAVRTEFGLQDTQRDRLIQSSNGLLKWLGLYALEFAIKDAEGARTVVQYTSLFSSSERIAILGWMTQHFAGDPKKTAIFDCLVDSLHTILPPKLNVADARLLVNSLRGHMRKLGWCEPWLYQHVLQPLWEGGRITSDDLCSIWVAELVAYLEETLRDQVCIFKRHAEGRITEVAAFLFSHSGPQQQTISIKSLDKILKTVQRDIRLPLASTLNWRKWNTSLVVTMWIFSFTQWASHFMTTPSGVEADLKRLADEARHLALSRPLTEWESQGVEPGALYQFIQEVGQI